MLEWNKVVSPGNHILQSNAGTYYGNHVLSDAALEVLNGAYDMHAHPSPYPSGMKDGDCDMFATDDISILREGAAVGEKGIVIKCHEFGSAARAWIANKYADCSCKAYGSLTFGYEVGGINPVAADTAAKYGAKVIWFPTVGTRHQHNLWGGAVPWPYESGADFYFRPDAPVEKPLGIYILDEDGNLKPEIYEVIEVCRDHNIALASGHLSFIETAEMFKAAKKMGLKKMIYTHIDWIPLTALGISQQKMFAEMGVYMEKCFYEFEPERALASFAHISPEHYILSSDATTPLSQVQTFGCMFDEYLDRGMSVADLKIMTHDNPEFLLEG